MADQHDPTLWTALGTGVAAFLTGIGATLGVKRKSSNGTSNGNGLASRAMAVEVRKLEDDALVMAVTVKQMEASIKTTQRSVEELRKDHDRTVERIFARLEGISIQLAHLGAPPPVALEDKT